MRKTGQKLVIVLNFWTGLLRKRINKTAKTRQNKGI